MEGNDRIHELEALITRYQASYYNGEGEIPDAEFDRLWDELRALDPGNALLHRVGADSGNFPKARHVMPMGSQEKAANPQEFLAWAQKHAYTEYLVEYKLDGASLELQYVHGMLVRAVTRGDGSAGDDITANARRMQGVRGELRLSGGARVDFTGGVRGEVIMTRAVHTAHFADKANCRNAANGLMKRKDGEGSEYLTLIAYDALATEGESPFADEEQKLAWLSACGFTPVVMQKCPSAEAVVDYRSRVMELRPSLGYDIDGLVIKERAIDLADARRDRPDRQIAFKFSLEEATSVVRRVEWNEAGATYTPVAVFDPVDLNGTTVQRASLVNPNTIRALGLQVGSHVVVVKRGEIIPKIERVLPGPGEGCVPVVQPDTCATCGTPLVDEGTRLFCPNKGCAKRVLHQIQKWVSVVDIRDCGDTLVRALFRDGRLTCIADLYRLDVAALTPYFLTEDSISQEKRSLGAEKVFASIQGHRQVTLPRFVAGFDIEGIGETVVEKLVEAGYTSLQKLRDASEEEIAAVYGFAQTMARTLLDGLAENRADMDELLAEGLVTVQEAAPGGSLAGLSFCFTGELSTMKRADAQALVKSLGGSVKSSVVKGLSYLVTNDTASGSAKNAKAAQLGIPVIDEERFLKLAGR